MIAENVFWLFCCFCHYYPYFLVMLSQYYGEISAIFIEALWKQIPSVSNFFGVPCGELIFIKEPWATPNRATPKSCYPCTKSEKSQKFKKIKKQLKKTIHAFQNEFKKTQKNKQEKTEHIPKKTEHIPKINKNRKSTNNHNNLKKQKI